MERDYTWAQNKLKLARAIGLNPKGTEEEIKVAYIKMAGVVLEVPKKTEVVEEAPKVKIRSKKTE